MFTKIRNWFIGRTPLSTRLYIGRVFVVLLPLLTFAKPTFAIAPLLLGGLIAGGTVLAGPIAKSIFGLLFTVILAVISFLTSVMIWVIDGLILPGQNSILFNPVIQEVWKSMQSAANVLFFVAILALSIMIITRSAGYNFKKAITSLITAVVLANLSFMIVHALVEAGDALRNSAAEIFGLSGTGTAELVELFYSKADLTGWGMGIGGTGTSVIEYILTGIFLIAISLAGLYVFFRLAFILIERAVRLILQAIFAPFIFALSVLPAGEFTKMQSKWWSDTIRWVLVLPLAFLLFGIAHKLLIDFQLPSVLQLIDGEATNTGEFIFAILIIAILLAAANVHTMLEVPLSSATKLFTDTAANFLPNLVGGAAKFQLGARAKLAGQALIQKKWGGTIYKKFAGSTEALKNKIESGEKIQEAMRKETARKIAFEELDEVDEIYNKGLDELSIQTYGVEYNDESLTDTQKIELKRTFNKNNPELYRRQQATARTAKVGLAGEVDQLAELDPAYETLVEGINKFMKIMTKKGTQPPDIDLLDETQQSDFRQNIGALHRQANKGGLAAVGPQLNLMNYKNKYGKKVFEKLLKDAKYIFPVADYRISEDKQRKFEREYGSSETRDSTTGSASEASSDKQFIEGLEAKENYKATQNYKDKLAKEVNDNDFVATVENINNREGGSAILQIMQEAAEQNNTAVLENISDVEELIESLLVTDFDNEDKIANIQSRHGSDKAALKTAFKDEMGMSEEDSEKASEVLSNIGVKEIGISSNVANSLLKSQGSERKTKINYIEQTQINNEFKQKYEESQQTTGATAGPESTKANEERIKAAANDANREPYSIDKIKEDTDKATEKLTKVILKSAKTTDERKEFYQKQLLGQIRDDNAIQLKKLALKIFSKLKHERQGSIINSEEQINQMTLKDVHKILLETGAAADKLSEENK